MRSSSHQNPFLFACGVPRSGTTLLQRLLNCHPELAVANDSHFIPRALELTGGNLKRQAEQGDPIELTPTLLANVGGYHRFYRLGIDEQSLRDIASHCQTYHELVSGIYDHFARQQDKRLAGEKTPDYLRRLSLLHAQFPEAKLIHLVRDGRSVALSLRQWAKPNKGPGRIELWNEHPTAVCALWWRWLVMEARAQSSQIDSSAYREIHYENLVSRTEVEMRSVCNFLGLTFHHQMLNFHAGKSKPASPRSAKSDWLAPQRGLRNWRQEMPQGDIELFEALASDALQMFGYPLHCGGYSDQTLAVAEQCKSWWHEHFISKHNPSRNASG